MISPRGLDFLVLLEGGMKLVEYEDSGGIPTIGVGHVIKSEDRRLFDHRNGLLHITHNQGLELLAFDLEWVYRVIRGTVHVSLEIHEYDALCCFIFNIGGTQWRVSTALRKLNNGRKQEIPPQMTRWTLVNGKRDKGLWNRRCATGALWHFADYNPDHILLGTA